MNDIAAPTTTPVPTPPGLLRAPRADLPLPAYESHSSISTYRDCPLRYAFRYVERVPGEERPWQYAFGSGVHHAFEAFVRERMRARDAGAPPPGPFLLRLALEESLAASGLGPDEIEAARERAEPVLERFLAMEAARVAEPVAVEIGFGVTIRPPGAPDGLRFVGYIDRVDRTADGSIEIVDYKTGRLREQADVDADRQLTAYAFAAARGALHDPATGEVLPAASRVGLYFADAGVLVWTQRDAEALAAFETDLGATVTRIRRREFPARPVAWRCDWCEYGRACAESAARSGPRAAASDPTSLVAGGVA